MFDFPFFTICLLLAAIAVGLLTISVLLNSMVRSRQFNEIRRLQLETEQYLEAFSVRIGDRQAEISDLNPRQIEEEFEKRNSEDGTHPVIQLLNEFENFAIKLNFGLLDEKLAEAHERGRLISFYAQSFPLILILRQRANNIHLYEHFEEVVARWSDKP